MAEAFWRSGARVAVCDADEKALEDFSAAVPDAGNSFAARADVSRPAEVGAFFAAAESRWGGLDVVCANAGIGGPAGAAEDLSPAGWRETLAVNLDGAFWTAQQAARILKAGGSGALLFTASTSGLFGHPMRSPYAAAKWGVIGLMKTLAMELGPFGIRVNAICPGAVEGARMERVLAAEAQARGTTAEAMRKVYARGVSLRRWTRAEDVANLAVFLASPLAADISGQALAVDGNTETFAP